MPVYLPPVRSQGGIVLYPGHYQLGGGLPRGGLGLSQMNTLSKQAHFGGLNTRVADVGAVKQPSVAAAKPAGMSTPMRPTTTMRGPTAPNIRIATPAVHLAAPSTRMPSMPAAHLGTPGAHLIHSPVPGRVDRIPMRARPGSFVLPADVVSGLGQGNTYAGAKMWGQALAHSAGPAGVTNTLKARSFHAPSLGRGFGAAARKIFQRGGAVARKIFFQRGGAVDNDELVPIVTSGGEMLIDPEIVEAIGRNNGGDAEHGKKILVKACLHVRKQVAEHQRKLPRPAS